jgi:hypothetical protein
LRQNSSRKEAALETVRQAADRDDYLELERKQALVFRKKSLIRWPFET